MKNRGAIGKNIFWIGLVIGFVWALSGAGRPPVSHAMSSMVNGVATDRGVQSGQKMPSSCPMKGSLPCCHATLQVALCGATLCDMCFVSKPWQGAAVSALVRVHPPVAGVIAYVVLNPPESPGIVQSLHSPFPSRSSVYSAVNRPLLI
ncbi:MAG: hypothetical protein ACYC9S_01480 [Leptospirales bacterium]